MRHANGAVLVTVGGTLCNGRAGCLIDSIGRTGNRFPIRANGVVTGIVAEIDLAIVGHPTGTTGMLSKRWSPAQPKVSVARSRFSINNLTIILIYCDRPDDEARLRVNDRPQDA